MFSYKIYKNEKMPSGKIYKNEKWNPVKCK